ncbi:MAG: hypothetical protein JRI55_19250, partial [Deltaproteobacteria bacterium]|nr:hypothetical protein [Deltaproteobacteria bacterium]
MLRRPTGIAVVAAALVALAGPARAGDEPDVFLHGSFENQLTGMWLNLYEGDEAVALYDYTRLRVDLDAELPGGLELRSDVVERLFVGQTE